ncbi:Rossmann-like domain-containing protein [Parasporobacterium paucivorans]|uniref:Uncharacterized conserved protein, contains DUF4213 and DUF364 domains n=1 Tax=Parasporobacterium paucivorans DSM 15970 TaxID=1122934 RepID=A0A1M6I5S5_9FIRM|nr:DUF364 domain-containing protein [Parasporobacterium paucivorans]SHJ29740.1 Uncharacterized conserved protein, contains DUF4213 and DUF364 domains [Parasporobacterium paucivorans DSM 15970]
MTEKELFIRLKEEFTKIIVDRQLTMDKVSIRSKALSVEEAIGITKRKDFPIITGKEILLQAEYKGSYGQAFTDAPAVFEGTLLQVLELDLANDGHSRGIFITAMNAVMCQLGLTDRTIHCKNEEPELCAGKFKTYFKEQYKDPKIALIGYQPSMLENLAEEFQVRVLDLNPDNIGQVRYGVCVEDGIKDYKEVVEWADIILCTGSTVCNGSIVNFMDLDKETIFFGTTVAGAASILGLKRICFESL